MGVVIVPFIFRGKWSGMKWLGELGKVFCLTGFGGGVEERLVLELTAFSFELSA